MTPKLGHKIALSALTLIVLFFLAGFIYTYLGDHAAAPKPNLAQAAAAQYKPIAPPPKPGPNADVGVAEEAFDTPVTPGSPTSIIINTTAGATCSISVTLNGVKDSDPALNPKVADAFGNVTWSWLVPSHTPFGNWPVAVTCRLGSHWAVFDDVLVVKD